MFNFPKIKGQKNHVQPLEICSFRSIFSFCDISFQKGHPTAQLHKIDILSLLAGRITEELVVKSFRRALGCWQHWQVRDNRSVHNPLLKQRSITQTTPTSTSAQSSVCSWPPASSGNHCELNGSNPACAQHARSRDFKPFYCGGMYAFAPKKRCQRNLGNGSFQIGVFEIVKKRHSPTCCNISTSCRACTTSREFSTAVIAYARKMWCQ